jgi:hypothetical protein
MASLAQLRLRAVETCRAVKELRGAARRRLRALGIEPGGIDG